MLKELDLIALTEHIPMDGIWHIPTNSPLRGESGPESGLLPGDVGTIVYVQGGGEAFEVEFLETDGMTVAIATVLPRQARLATDEDLAKDRFGKRSLPA